MKNKLMAALGGIFIGVMNGLLGAGGGMLAVPMLKKLGADQTKAHATAVAVIYPLSSVSAAAYMWLGRYRLPNAVEFLLPGAVGALAGALVLAKIPQMWLRKIFAVLLIWAGIRMVMR